MLRVLDCIRQSHDLRLVVLAAVLCLCACATAIGMLARAQLAGRGRGRWVLASGAVAGSGIWATHFIAMLAFRPDLPVGYAIGPTLLSILIAIGLSTAGFAIALRKGGAVLGGVVAGAAIGAMHYVGMAALRAPLAAEWDRGYVLASLAIGIGLGALALRVALAREARIWNAPLGTLVFVAAICGLHFTAMAAVTYRLVPGEIIPSTHLMPGAMAVAVAAVSGLVVALGFMGMTLDHRLAVRASREAEVLREHVAALETTKRELEATSENLAAALQAAAAGSEAKSRFLAAMSHELRTPLNAILGFSDVLRREMLGPHGEGRYKEYASLIHGSGTNLLRLINDLLDISRLDTQALTLEERNIAPEELISEAIRLTEEQAGAAGITLCEEPHGRLPMVTGDWRLLLQVLVKLLSNAVTFSKPGGVVRIGAWRSEAGLVMRISDTGIGMASEDIPRALEAFSQVDNRLARKYQGAGLGLPLAKHFMELHGGTLLIESVTGEGTAVTVTLPSSRVLPVRRVAS